MAEQSSPMITIQLTPAQLTRLAKSVLVSMRATEQARDNTLKMIQNEELNKTLGKTILDAYADSIIEDTKLYDFLTTCLGNALKP